MQIIALNEIYLHRLNMCRGTARATYEPARQRRRGRIMLIVPWIHNPAQIVAQPMMEGENFVNAYVRQYGTPTRTAYEFFTSQHLDFVIPGTLENFISLLSDTYIIDH